MVVVEGYDCIEIVRKLSRNTIPVLCSPRTVREIFHMIQLIWPMNKPTLKKSIHASDVEDGEKEVALWLTQELF